MQEREEVLTREIAWNSLIGPHADAKKIPKSRDKFWKIGNKKNVSDVRMQEAIKKAQDDYFKELERQKNG
jgi:hypothetical protein